jgi:type I restriction enzyme M protein
VVSNASPLFNSDSGPTSIRQWLFSSDLIDTIIALPTQMFFGTGIATYVWILDNDKPEKRRGRIQLIDASGLWEPMRKTMGYKRRWMSQNNRDDVVRAYRDFTNSSISRVMTPQDFMFRDVPVFKQAHLATRVTDEAIETVRGHRGFTQALVPVLQGLDGIPWNLIPKRLPAAAKAAGLKAGVGLVDAVMKAVGVPDESAPPAVDRKGKPVAVKDWKITERVPDSESLDDHMTREVLPFAPEARWDESKAKHGTEIPFTRIFYVPEEPRPLAEIDADVQRIMGELTEMFQGVKTDD